MQQLAADVVVSSLDPRHTFLELVDPWLVPEDLLQAVKNYTFRGSSAKVNLALDAAPELACKPGLGRHLAGAISISPSVDYLERAYDTAKYGDFSRNIFQGELSLSQLFFLRPAPGYAQYKTPISGYYQCGSGTHPGGGITGAPGRLAAGVILGDLN